MRKLLAVLLLSPVVLVSGCMEFDFPTTTGPFPNGPVNFATQDVTVAAGMSEIQPATTDTLSGVVNASRFGVTNFDRVYELETPAGTDFAFNIIARGESNWGLTRITVGHVEAAGVVPTTGVESIAAAGMTLEAPGMANTGNQVDVNGDGFARVTVRGNITSDQVLMARVPRFGDELLIGIRVKIGNASAINLSAGNPQGFRGGMTTTSIYSSDAWQFGLPAMAVSGDRYSIVTYDGNQNQQSYVDRRRTWLQLDTSTSAITGGDEECYSPDSGFWRDQEIAALGTVLAVAYTGSGNVRAEISLNRGGSFPLVRDIDPNAGWGTRLVQIAIAPDYRLGVIYWKNQNSSGAYTSSRLMLVEATPTAFDSNNTPIGYAWGQPTVVHNAGYDATPLLMHMEYSQGGDLVIGYGYTTMTWSGWFMVSSSRFRCAVRQWGSQGFYDTQIDQEDNVMPCDPHVCVLGSGSTMEIFYAYEKSDGVHLYYSSNSGATFQLAHSVNIPGAMQPSVHARMQGGQKRVDLLFVSPDGWGLELHDLTWDDFTLSATPTLSRITQADAVGGGTPPAGMPQGFLITTLSWMGYDAVIKGDDVAVVFHEITYDSYEYYWANGWMWQQGGGGFAGAAGGGGGGGGSGGGYTPPPPPTILQPGMTGSVATPDPAHRNQLRVAVID
jgi:hypothetical protein